MAFLKLLYKALQENKPKILKLYKSKYWGWRLKAQPEA